MLSILLFASGFIGYKALNDEVTPCDCHNSDTTERNDLNTGDLTFIVPDLDKDKPNVLDCGCG